MQSCSKAMARQTQEAIGTFGNLVHKESNILRPRSPRRRGDHFHPNLAELTAAILFLLFSVVPTTHGGFSKNCREKWAKTTRDRWTPNSGEMLQKRADPCRSFFCRFPGSDLGFRHFDWKKNSPFRPTSSLPPRGFLVFRFCLIFAKEKNRISMWQKKDVTSWVWTCCLFIAVGCFRGPIWPRRAVSPVLRANALNCLSHRIFLSSCDHFLLLFSLLPLLLPFFFRSGASGVQRREPPTHAKDSFCKDACLKRNSLWNCL